MCSFRTKGGLSFKVGSVSCDPDCPYCRNWSRELEDGASLKRSYIREGHS